MKGTILVESTCEDAKIPNPGSFTYFIQPSGTVTVKDSNGVCTAIGGAGRVLIGEADLSHLAAIPITTTPQPLPHNQNDKINGIVGHSETVNNSRITFSASGSVSIISVPQLRKTGGTAADAYFWIRKNGTTAIENSAIADRGLGNGDTRTVVLVSNLDVISGDYLEVMAQASANNEFDLEYDAPSGSGPTERPSVPSVITIVSVHDTV